MILVLFIKLLFLLLITRYVIYLVHHHFNHNNKTTRVFRGNCSISKDVMLALLYGIKTKARFKFKDLSYRKSLAEWMKMINGNYPSDNLNIIPPSNVNKNQFPFPKLETGNNNLIHFLKLYSHSNFISKNNAIIDKSKISHITHLSHTNTNSNHNNIPFKILKNTPSLTPFPKPMVACTCQLLRFDSVFISNSIRSYYFHLQIIKLPIQPISSAHWHIGTLLPAVKHSLAMH